MTFEIALAFGILFFALALFLLDWFSADFVAIITMGTILALGPILDVSPQEAISGFSNPATITVVFVFVLSAAVQHTGLVNILAQRMIKWGGQSEHRQLLTICGIAGPLSAFINNTAAVAIMIPAVIRMATAVKRAPSKLLIPLSYASQLAGVVTLIGTSTNILASTLSDEAGYGAFSMFEFSTIGLGIFAVGLIYLVFVVSRLLPARVGEEEPLLSEQVDITVLEVVVAPDSDIIGGTVVSTNFRNRFQATIIAIRQRGELIREGLRDVVFDAGDILVVEGEQQAFDRLREEPTLIVLEEFDLEVLDVVIGPDSDLIGGSLLSTNFRNRYRATVIAIKKGSELIRRNFGDIRLEFGDTLLLEGTSTAFEQLRRDPGFIVTEGAALPEYRPEKIPIAVAILVGVVVAAAFGYSILIAVVIGSVLMVVTGCLTVTEFRNAIRWDVILLLAGMIPLGIMLQNTGAADYLADFADSVAGSLPAVGTLFIFYVATSILTSVISNNGAVVLMVPVGIASAVSLDIDPKAVILAIMFAASTSFITPMGYQTNTMVLGPGGYRFSDYLRAGGPLNIILAFATPLLIVAIWGV